VFFRKFWASVSVCMTQALRFSSGTLQIWLYAQSSHDVYPVFIPCSPFLSFRPFCLFLTLQRWFGVQHTAFFHTMKLIRQCNKCVLRGDNLLVLTLQTAEVICQLACQSDVTFHIKRPAPKRPRGIIEVCAFQVCAFHVCASHVCASHVCVLQVCALHVCALQVYALHVCALHVCALHV